MSVLARLAPEVDHTCPNAAEPVVGGDMMAPLVTCKDRPMERGPETGEPIERAHGLQVGCHWMGVEGHVQGQMIGMLFYCIISFRRILFYSEISEGTPKNQHAWGGY